MDLSVILVMPFSALVAFIVVIGATMVKRPRPRLIWPFALSTLTAAPVFVGLPEREWLSFWAFAFLGLAIWAAMGTVIGGLATRAVVAAIRYFRAY